MRVGRRLSQQRGLRSLVMGIETSCDDTGVAIVGRDDKGQGVVVAQVLQSQWDLIRRFGGVFPNEARRQHEQVIDGIVDEALRQGNITGTDLDSIAVTLGPGLAPCLAVGMRKAEALAREYSKPLLAVHHVAAHTLMPMLTNPELKFPLVALVVSGGHTLVVSCRGIEPSDFSIMGQSLDDNVGEAFDKVWRLLLEFLEKSPEVSEAELQQWTSSHPGAALERLAGRNARRGFESLFAIPMQMKPKQRKSYDFSFSGLKAAVAREIARRPFESVDDAAFIAAAFQYTAIEHLALTTEKALRKLSELQGIRGGVELVVSGGVAANQNLQQRLSRLSCVKQLVVPPNHQCVDNGVMIAWNGLLRMEAGHTPEDLDRLSFDPKWPFQGKRAKGKN